MSTYYVRIYNEDKKDDGSIGITGKKRNQAEYLRPLHYVLFSDALMLKKKVCQHVRLNYLEQLDSGHLTETSLSDVIALDFDSKDGEFREWDNEAINHGGFLKAIVKALNLEEDSVGAVWTGYGLHVFVCFDKMFNQKEAKASWWADLTYRLSYVSHPFLAFDSQSLIDRKCIRKPKSWYKKEGKREHYTTIVKAPSRPMSLETFLARQPEVVKTKEVDQEYMDGEKIIELPRQPDVDAMFKNCSFMGGVWNNRSKLPYPLWFAGLSVVAKASVDKTANKALARRISSADPRFKEEEFSQVYEKARGLKNPYSCSKIDQMMGKDSVCQSCQYYKKIPTPLHAEDYPHKATGFRDKTSLKPPNKLDTENLAMYAKRNLNYMVSTALEFFRLDKGAFHYVASSMKELEDEVQGKYVFNPLMNIGEAEAFRHYVKTHGLTNISKIIEENFNLFRFQNGVFNVETREFSKEVRNDAVFFTSLPFSYDKDAVAPRFYGFLKWALGKDEMDFLMKYLAQAIFAPKNERDQRAMILYGTGANGKSTLIDLIMSLFANDTYIVPFNPEAFKSDSQYYSLFRNARIAYCSDIDSNAFNSKSNDFKRLISKEASEFRVLYSTKREGIRPHAQLIAGCNSLPRFSDTTEGMLRRFAIIPFNKTVREDDRDVRLLEKLKSERAGIFNLLYETYLNLYADGVYRPIKPPASSVALVTKGIAAGSFIASFIDSRIQHTEGTDPRIEPDWLSFALLWSVFQRWWKRTLNQPMTMTRQAFLIKFAEYFSNRLVKHKKNTGQGYLNIRLKDEE